MSKAKEEKKKHLRNEASLARNDKKQPDFGKRREPPVLNTGTDTKEFPPAPEFDKGYLLVPFTSYFNGRVDDWSDANDKTILRYVRKSNLSYLADNGLALFSSYQINENTHNSAIDVMLWSAYAEKTMKIPTNEKQLSLHRSYVKFLNNVMGLIMTSYHKLLKNRHACAIVLDEIGKSEYLEWIHAYAPFKAYIAEQERVAGHKLSNERFNAYLFEYLMVLFNEKRYDVLLENICIKTFGALMYMLDSEVHLRITTTKNS